MVVVAYFLLDRLCSCKNHVFGLLNFVCLVDVLCRLERHVHQMEKLEHLTSYQDNFIPTNKVLLMLDPK